MNQNARLNSEIYSIGIYSRLGSVKTHQFLLSSKLATSFDYI